MAKKIIGIIATAAAAAIVTTLTNRVRVESLNRTDKASDPTRSRRPIAEASAMRNPITLLRRRSSNPDFVFWSNMVVSKESYPPLLKLRRDRLVSKLAAVIGMKSARDARVGESPSSCVGWLHFGCDSELPKKLSPALGCSKVGKVQCAALR